MKLLFINGVNLNMTGRRERGVYGTQTLDEINAEIAARFKGVECEFSRVTQRAKSAQNYTRQTATA